MDSIDVIPSAQPTLRASPANLHFAISIGDYIVRVGVAPDSRQTSRQTSLFRIRVQGMTSSRAESRGTGEGGPSVATATTLTSDRKEGGYT